MTTDVTIVAGSWRKWWPFFVAGFCGPLLGFFLARWLPFHFAMGIGGFVAWTAAGVVFARRSAPKWGVPGWLAVVIAGAAGGLTVGVLWFLFP
jgi:uncharacterized membrane protein YjjP (DUF1212 family)